MNGILPHPPTSLLFVNIADVTAILLFATALTFLHHALLFWGIQRPYKSKLKAQMRILRALRYETIKLRAKGLVAFVETSKMERKLLAKEKEIEELQAKQTKRMQLFQKWAKRLSNVTYLILFVLYFKTPLIRVAGIQPDLQTDGGDWRFTKGMLFPHSMMGLGNKIANYGMGNGGIGALMVYFSTEVSVGRFLECCEIILSP